jgi:hypothetical protein
VQGAIDYELQPLLDALEGRRSRQISAWTFWEGRIGAKRVVVSRTEVDPINVVLQLPSSGSSTTSRV